MSSDESAGDAEDPGQHGFIIMRASETFDGQERVMTRASYNLQIMATAHSATCGHPGFVPDDYLEYVDGLSIETTLAAAELCTVGMWERVDGGYRVLDWEAVEVCLDEVRQRQGEDPLAQVWDRDNETKIWAQLASPVDVTPPCAVCGTPTTRIELAPPEYELADWDRRPHVVRATVEQDRAPGQWYLLITGPAPETFYGTVIDISRARRIALAFRPPLSFAQVHTAGLYDDAGFCPLCDVPYCPGHWDVSAEGDAWCPRGHGKNLNSLWLS